MFIVTLFTIAKIWKQCKCPSTNDKNVACVYIYIYTHTQWNISHKKEWSSAICNNVEGPKEYYA